MRPLLALLIAPLLIGATAIGLTASEPIAVGDQAPALKGLTIVKGGEPKPLDAGIVSVVELWATWCAPCRTSIPHLTALQAKHGERLQIIGITEEDEATVVPFVEEFGERMVYHVAANAGETYRTYGQGVRGIPFAYIINGEGIVVWKGHPMGMDDTLEQVINGTFNPAVEQAAENLRKSFESNNPAAIGAANDALLSMDPAHRLGIDVGIRLAEINDDPGQFRALFSRVAATDLSGSQAALLIDAQLASGHVSWIEPKTLKALSERCASADDGAHLLARARVAHFFGDIEGAKTLASKAHEAEEAEAAAYLALFQALGEP